MLDAVGLGAAGAVLLALATLTTNFVNIYMSALAWKSLFPAARDAAVVWSIGLIGTALSAIPGVWLERYTSFMVVLGAVLVPVGGVLVAHYYSSVRRHERRSEITASTDRCTTRRAVPGCERGRHAGVGCGRGGVFRRRIHRRYAAGAGHVDRGLPGCWRGRQL